MRNELSAKAKSHVFVATAERAFSVARKLRAEGRALEVKIPNPLKVPFRTAKFCRLRNARHLTWRDAFEVAFEDGIASLKTHQAV